MLRRATVFVPMLLATIGLTLVTLPVPISRGADAKAVGANKQIDDLVAKAVEFLRTKGQAADGSFSGQTGSGVTSLVTAGLLKNGRSVDDPMVAKALKYLEGLVQPDGGVYPKGSLYQNYDTCLAIMCFQEANKQKKGRYDKIVKNAEKLIREQQWDKGEGLEDSDVRYGGAGYGKSKRPDLSNTTFFIDALKSVGAGADDPAIKAALKFVSQCQNFESEHNTGPFAAKNPDGGFVYTSAGDGASMAADKLPNGGLRSYASMTYAGLKSMIYAGVDAKDPRVKAAVAWVKKNYDLKTNPGMGTAGLYYYYHTFAKALDALGEETFEDSAGKKHDWRKDLVAELAKNQRKDGSWINDNARWMEGDPNLTIGFVLMTLPHCRTK